MKIKKTLYSIAAIAILVLSNVAAYSSDSPIVALRPFLKNSTLWKVEPLNRDVPLNIYFAGEQPAWGSSEVIIYMKNKAWERIGRESDASILKDYIEKKFIVITVDYGKDKKAVSPALDVDLNNLFRAVYGFKTVPLLKDLSLSPKEYRCFFLPEGYRVATDLVYWEIDKHAAFGTMEYIMKSYNEDIVSKVPGLKMVSSPGQMVDRKGNPFDFTVKMDIVYPSQAKKKVPVIFHSETLSARNPNERPQNFSPHFAGFLTRGYSYVVMGHCFNPCVNHYFHFGKFTLDHWNGYACYTAAIRFLHAHANKYGINPDYIGGIGYSKGQYAITRLSDPNHEGGEESQHYAGYPKGSPAPQPWQGFSSKIAAGMQGMGMGLFETEYITADYAPNILICGENDREVITKAHPVFVKKLEALNANHISLFMKDQGHELPYGYDKVMGVDRYQLVHNFFDRYLRVEAKLPPVVLMISPYDKKAAVSSDAAIAVQFAPVIDELTILKKKGIIIIRTKDNNEVEGKWKPSHGGTKYTFTPTMPLAPGEAYQIKVTSKVKDKRGSRLKEQKSVLFTVANQ